MPHFVPLSSLQKGKDNYKLAATSENGGQKSKKARKKKDMDELKKEVDLVSTQLTCSCSVIICNLTGLMSCKKSENFKHTKLLINSLTVSQKEKGIE